ncbi:bifunctional metallophosphatase/5'-nucleotidase [bacterium]|nr:bifunctional metallophosphatase/5'-nucleotidase [bacterium]
MGDLSLLIRLLVYFVVFGWPLWALARPIRITLLHLNDVYEYLTVDDGRKGSFARLETLRQRVRRSNPNTLFLFAGDTLSPSVASSFYRGKQMIDLWNAVGLDVATLGNHEFDFGPQILRERMAESRFPWLAANVKGKNESDFVGEFVIREVGGVKLGIFGLLAPDTRENSNCGPNIVFEDPVEAARRVVPRMREAGAEVIIGLTHLTLEDDKRVARAVPLDLILGGHEHEPLQSLVNGCPIFKWGSDARILGQVDLDVEDGKVLAMDWKGLSVGRSVQEDARIARLVSDYEVRMTRELSLPVVTLTVDADGRSVTCRHRESNLGNLVADAMRASAGADVALITGSSIRVNKVIPAGTLTRRQAMMILPYENGVSKVELNGQQLRQVVEHSLGSLNDKSSPFPQVSNMNIDYDPRRPAGQRVTRLWVGGRPCLSEKNYTFACSEFIRKGGCGFDMLPGARLLSEPHDSPSEGVALLEYLIRQKTVSPRLEGRIRCQDGR